MTTNITAYDARLEAIEATWTEVEGIGPCGHYAAWRRQLDGWQVAACTVAAADGRPLSFGHYVNIVGGLVVDLSNPFSDLALVYEDLEVLDADEMPELVDAASLLTFSHLIAAGG